MKDIMVMLVQTQDLNLVADQPSDVVKVTREGKSIMDNDSLPQFWTWFIENPRPGSSRSSSRVQRSSRNAKSS